MARTSRNIGSVLVAVKASPNLKMMPILRTAVSSQGRNSICIFRKFSKFHSTSIWLNGTTAILENPEDQVK